MRSGAEMPYEPRLPLVVPASVTQKRVPIADMIRAADRVPSDRAQVSVGAREREREREIE